MKNRNVIVSGSLPAYLRIYHMHILTPCMDRYLTIANIVAIPSDESPLICMLYSLPDISVVVLALT